jgi:hypothetical protein
MGKSDIMHGVCGA